jgi:acyl-CoA thioester hydrolase
MSRIDRSRLEGARFPVIEEVPTRWGDLDMQGHVNNAAAVVILQEGRVKFNRAAKLPAALGDLRAMVVGLSVEYAAEMHHPEPAEVHTGILAIGRSSFTVGQIIRQRGRTTIYAESSMVMANAGGAAPIPDPLRSALEALRIIPAPASQD